MCEYVWAFILLLFFVWWEEGSMEAGVAKALKSRRILLKGIQSLTSPQKGKGKMVDFS